MDNEPLKHITIALIALIIVLSVPLYGYIIPHTDAIDEEATYDFNNNCVDPVRYAESSHASVGFEWRYANKIDTLLEAEQLCNPNATLSDYIGCDK